MERQIRIWSHVLAALCLLFLLTSFPALVLRLDYAPIAPSNIAYMAMDCMGISLMAVLMYGALHEGETDRGLNMRFMVLLFSMVFAMNTDFWVWAADNINAPMAIRINYLSNSLYYLANTAVIHTFAIYLKRFLPRWPRWADFFHAALRVYYGVLVAALIVNRRTPFLFDIVDGSYVRGRWSLVSFAVAGVFAAALIVLISIQQMDRTEKISTLFYVLLPVAAMILQSVTVTLSFIPVSFVIATASLYVDGHVRQSRLLQAQQLRTQQQQTALTLSQLRPHFLYNTLTSAAYLCRKDPPRAERVIMDFAGYLRSNLSALQSPEPIPFSQELAHIRSYLNIEKIRFADRLQVVYHIDTEDFLLPSLTVQPLVENAVKHGIFEREEGGTVTITTQQTGSFWRVIVSDNGAGFDPDSVDWEDGAHVGLRSVQNRLRAYGDYLTLSSRPDEGTTVIITIPKQEDKS